MVKGKVASAGAALAIGALSFSLTLFGSLGSSGVTQEKADRVVGAGSSSGREEKVDYSIALPEHVEKAYKDCDTSDSQLPDGRDCLRDRFAELVSEHGVLPVLNGIGMYREQNNLTCHQTAHVMGQGAYKAIGDLAEAYSVPKAGLCEFGYYHGALQGWALEEGAENVIPQFNSVCNTLRNRDGEEGDCIHALGHAIGVFLDPEVSERACVTLQGQAVMYCWYGYEMENVEHYTQELQNLRDTDPEAADKRAYDEMRSCAQHDNNLIRMSCYRFRTTLALTLLGDDRVVELLKFCAKLGEGEAECFKGTVGENVSLLTALDDPAKPAPDYYCEMARTTQMKVDCYHMIGYTRLLLLNTYEAAAEACAFARDLEDECLRKLQPDWERYIEDQEGYYGTGTADDVGA